MSLTPKQQRFVDEYLVDLNATQAAIRAGYSEKTASVIAAENLSKPNIAQSIQEAMKKRGQRTGVTADRVLLEIERLAMFDPVDLIDVKSIEDIALLPEDVRRAITGWKWDKNGNFILTMAKQGALDMLGRHHRLFTDKTEHTGPNGGPIASTITLDEPTLEVLKQARLRMLDDF